MIKYYKPTKIWNHAKRSKLIGSPDHTGNQEAKNPGCLSQFMWITENHLISTISHLWKLFLKQVRVLLYHGWGYFFISKLASTTNKVQCISTNWNMVILTFRVKWSEYFVFTSLRNTLKQWMEWESNTRNVQCSII